VACTTDQGLAFTWGKGSKGRLGHGTSDSQLLPKNIVSLSGIKIVQVACGWSHSLFLSSEGHVFACGSGRDGTLGIGTLVPLANCLINEFNHLLHMHIAIRKSRGRSCAVFGAQSSREEHSYR
jgi:alpha-tubulin suppressor-like RCC1 family protein